MRVARLASVGNLVLHDEPAPEPQDGELLVRIDAVGLCGSDLHWYADGGIGDSVLARPLVLGHEMSGVVVSGSRTGERVAIDPAVPCGSCVTCLTGHRNLCPTVRFAGHGTTDGGLRELIAWPEAQLYPLPESIGAGEGAVLEPLGVAIHAIDLAHIRIGSAVTVIGCGPIGLLIVQLARVAGAASVVAVEPLAHRRAAALRYGADTALDPADAAPLGMYAAGLEAPGSDVVLEVVGSPSAVDLAVRAARPGGRVVLVGIPDDDSTTFPASVARRKGLTLAVARRMNHVYPRAIDMVAKGLVDATTLITDRIALEDVGTAFAAAVRRDGLKVLVEVSRQ